MAADDMDTVMEIDPAVDGEDEEIIRTRIINEEYKVWKKNAHYLYDTFYGTALDWPTLTTQWFPDRKISTDDNMATHRLLLGTHTSGEEHPNYIKIAHFSSPIGPKPDPAEYNPETEEIGGHGGARKSAPASKFEEVQRIPHEGEVNKARYMPQNYELIGTMTNSGKACIFDRTKHPSQPTGPVNPQIELVGHTDEGFALNWNPTKEGELATGSNDSTVKLWDIQAYTKTSKTLSPTATYTHHSASVNDIHHHPALPWLLATVSDDLSLHLLDTRQTPTTASAKHVDQAHKDAINAVRFNPTAEYILATASSDGSIALWDLRMLSIKLHALEGHKGSVDHIAWAPFSRSVLGSAGADRRVIFWDLANVGKEQTPEDAEDGVPELLFMHGGHTNGVADFDWCPVQEGGMSGGGGGLGKKGKVTGDEWMCVSAAEDNLLHVWRPNRAVLGLDGGEDVTLEELEA